MKLSDTERATLHNQMTAKPFLTDDLMAVEEAVARLHGDSVLRLGDPSKEWSYENRAPCEALVILGGFRAGKTTTAREGIKRLKPLPVPGGYLAPKPLEMSASPNFSVEGWARELLDKMLGQPARSLGPIRTIERLHRRIRIKKPTLLWIDEAQRMLTPERVGSHRLSEEQIKIFSQLRSLMDLTEAQVPVVISGTFELVPVLERDDLGFFRDRKNIIVIEPMKIGEQDDEDCLDDALHAFADAIDMKPEGLPKDFYKRLTQAANRARGLAFEICQEALVIAFEEGRKFVGPQDFEAFYARKAGCHRNANPFVATDWHHVNPAALMATMLPKPVKITGAKK